MIEKLADTQYPIHELLQKRWSPRAFSDRLVDEADLLSLFEAARWAPSSSNAQPWAFLLATKADAEMHARFVDILSVSNRLWAASAPVLLLAVARLERRPGMPNLWSGYDLGQAVAYFTVQAEALGLSLRQMGGFDRQLARELFAIPASHDPITAIALGYRAAPEDMPEDVRLRELEPRTRLPLSEFVFQHHFGQPLLEEDNAAASSPLRG
jgi:nitroreductase